MEKIQLFYAHRRKHMVFSVIRQMVPHVSKTLSVIRTKALAIFENKQWRHHVRLYSTASMTDFHFGIDEFFVR
jgi:ribosomal protein L13